MMLQNFQKNQNFKDFLHSWGMKCRVKVNNNREAVDVCVRYVVKRTSKRSVLVDINLLVENF